MALNYQGECCPIPGVMGELRQSAAATWKYLKLPTVGEDVLRRMLQRKAAYWANPEAAKIGARYWRSQNIERAKSRDANKHLLRAYGLSLEAKQQMFEEQAGKCKICKDPLGSFRKACVDHSHATGKVRGLLCASCNRGLGFFKDSKILLSAALSYLD